MMNVKNNIFMKKEEQNNAKWRKIMEVIDEVLKVHGVAPGNNGEDATRVIYENPNRFNSRINCNEKL